MDNLEHILAIELMNATQGIDFRRPLRSSPYIEKFLSVYRKEVPFIREDIVMCTKKYIRLWLFETSPGGLLSYYFTIFAGKKEQSMNSDNKEEMFPHWDEQGNIVGSCHTRANHDGSKKTSSGSAPPRIQQQR